MALIHCGHAALPAEPLYSGPEHQMRLEVAIQGDRFVGFDLHMRLKVVLQVLADMRCVQHHRHTVLFQMRPWADAGQHQQLRRAEGTGRQNDFSGGAGFDHPAPVPALGIFDADRTALLDHDPQNLGAGDNVQVLPFGLRMQVSPG